MIISEERTPPKGGVLFFSSLERVGRPSCNFYMKGVELMARDMSKPMEIQTPDGDSINLITWEFVLKQLDQQFSETLNLIENNNEQLRRIDRHFDDLIN